MVFPWAKAQLGDFHALHNFKLKEIVRENEWDFCWGITVVAALLYTLGSFSQAQRLCINHTAQLFFFLYDRNPNLNSHTRYIEDLGGIDALKEGWNFLEKGITWAKCQSGHNPTIVDGLKLVPKFTQSIDVTWV